MPRPADTGKSAWNRGRVRAGSDTATTVNRAASYSVSDGNPIFAQACSLTRRFTTPSAHTHRGSRSSPTRSPSRTPRPSAQCSRSSGYASRTWRQQSRAACLSRSGCSATWRFRPRWKLPPGGRLPAIDRGKYPVLMRLGVYGRSVRDRLRPLRGRSRRERRTRGQLVSGRTDGVAPVPPALGNTVGRRTPARGCQRGYVVVRVDGRGVGNTPGELDPFSRQEALDYFDAIQWAAEQPWSNGKVGLYGGWYNATVQWNVAGLRPPALRAIAPIASDSDAYRDLAYPGGIFLEGYRRWWFEDMVGREKEETPRLWTDRRLGQSSLGWGVLSWRAPYAGGFCQHRYSRPDGG